MANQHAASRMMRSDNQQLRRAVRRALHVVTPAAMLLLSAGPAWAAPEQGAVVRGAASIEAAGPGTLNINQTSDRAVINWRSFSIGRNEQVNFNQPGSSSATLNRVLGGQRSVIEGALNANGNVYLLNSSGILFSSSARVDVGGLVATTSEIRDDDFMRGQLQFNSAAAPGASIANFGTISVRDGGIAALVAPSVRNQGVIAARAGRVALGAGDVFTLDLYGDQLINFAVPASLEGAVQSRTVDQAGTITADGGQILMTTDAAAGVVSGVVNMSGITQARTVEQTATGEIVLVGNAADVNVSGTLDVSGTAPGAVGGTVDVFGRNVQLTDTAVVDARGAAGGGVVRLGGGLASEQTSRAETTTIASGATIDVSATDAGNGGTVAVWGNDKAEFAGTIDARGGAAGGDGGFVEVSSKGLLQFLGNVYAEAPHGKAGTVLLDPESIRIEAIGSNSPAASVIAASALNGLLRQGLAVILLADNSITVNAAIDGRPLDGSGTASGSVDLTAGSILVLQPIITENSSITLRATTGDVSFNAQGYLYVANGTGAGNAAINVRAANSVLTSANGGQLISLGTISVRADAGNVRLSSGLYGLNSPTGSTGIGSLDVQAAGNVELAGASTATGNVSVLAGGNITNRSNSIVSAGDITLDADGAILIEQVLNGGNVATGLSAVGDVTLLAGGAVTLNSGVVAQGAKLRIGSSAVGGQVASVTMGTGAALFAQGTAGDADGIEIHSTGDVSLRGASSSGDVRVTTGASGNIVLAERSIVAQDDVVLAAGNALTLQAIGAEPVATGIDAGDDVELRASGAVQLNSSVRAQGASVKIGASDAAVASLTMGSSAALFAEGTAADADGIEVHAAGNVVLRGASSSGDVRVTTGAAGSIRNSDRLITAADDVVLSAGTTLAIDRIADTSDPTTAAIAVDGDDVTLLAQGAVTLDGSIRATGANLSIGTAAARVAALSMGTGAALFVDGATPAAGGIEVNSTGDVNLRGAISSGDVRVLSTAGSVSNSDKTIRADGAIALTAAQNLALNRVAQGVDERVALSAAGDIDLLAAGRVQVASEIVSTAGSVDIGTAANPVDVFDMDPTTAIRTSGTGHIAVFGDLITTGSLFGGTGGVDLRVLAGQRINILGPILSAGPVQLGLAVPNVAQNAHINLSHNIFTTGQSVTLNGDVVLFEGISFWDIEEALGRPVEGWTTDAYVDAVNLFGLASFGFESDGGGVNEVDNRICTSSGCVGADRAALLSQLCVQGQCGAVLIPDPLDPDPNNPTLPLVTAFQVSLIDGLRFTGSQSDLVRRLINPNAAGFQANDPTTTAPWIGFVNLNVSPDGIENEIAAAALREQRWRTTLGRLTATIDTTGAGGSPTGAAIELNGSLERYSPYKGVNDPLTQPGLFSVVYPSFVSHGLTLTAGAADVTIAGEFGDTARDLARTGSDGVSVFTESVEVNTPLLGTFGVRVRAGNLITCATCNATRFINELDVQATGLQGSLPADRGVSYSVDVAWTDSDKGALSPTPGAVPVVPGTISFEPVGTRGDLDPTGTLDSTSGNNTSTGGLVAGSADGATTPGSTLESEQHRDESKVKDSAGDPPLSEEDEKCPRGAGQSADLGATRSVDGAAEDVFSRCSEAG